MEFIMTYRSYSELNFNAKYMEFLSKTDHKKCYKTIFKFFQSKTIIYNINYLLDFRYNNNLEYDILFCLTLSKHIKLKITSKYKKVYIGFKNIMHILILKIASQ